MADSSSTTLQPGENVPRLQESPLPVSRKPDEDAIRKHIELLRERARKLRLLSGIILWLLVMPSIVLAVVIVVQAPSVSGVESARYEIARLRAFEEERQMLLSSMIELARRIEEGGLDPEESTNLNRQLGRIDALLSSLREPVSIGGESTISSIVQVVQVNIVRFGTIVVIFFGVAIFIGIYRHQIRLAVFYDTSADAFDLYLVGGISEKAFSEIVLRAPVVEFGKLPSVTAYPTTALKEP